MQLRDSGIVTRRARHTTLAIYLDSSSLLSSSYSTSHAPNLVSRIPQSRIPGPPCSVAQKANYPKSGTVGDKETGAFHLPHLESFTIAPLACDTSGGALPGASDRDRWQRREPRCRCVQRRAHDRSRK